MMDQEAKDRLEIQELLARYSWAMADKDWDAWQSVFAPGATVDYSTAGGPVGTPAEAAAALSAMMQAFDVAMSQGTNLVITFESTEQASCRSMYRMLMRLPSANPTDAPTYMEAQGEYQDTLVRTLPGWRIARRYEALAYVRA
jgi:hypothetical protein